MNDDDKRRIMNEARVTLATKDSFAQPTLPSTDPPTRWREESAKLEAERRAGAQELRDEERRRCGNSRDLGSMVYHRTAEASAGASRPTFQRACARRLRIDRRASGKNQNL